MNRSEIKSIVKKLILQEITKADYGVGTAASKEDARKDLEKAVKSAGGEMIDNPLNNKLTVDDKQGGRKFQVDLYEQGEDCYDVTAIFNGSDRKIAKSLSIKDAIEFVKKGLEDSKKSYTDRANEKSVKSGKVVDAKDSAKKAEKEEEKASDKMEEVDEKTQTEIANKTDVKAEEKPNKEISPIHADIAAQLGGDLVDKIDKVIDRVLKSKVKADAKTSFLKADKDMESPDKLTVKDKGTPELKEKKK